MACGVLSWRLHRSRSRVGIWSTEVNSRMRSVQFVSSFDDSGSTLYSFGVAWADACNETHIARGIRCLGMVFGRGAHWIIDTTQSASQDVSAPETTRLCPPACLMDQDTASTTISASK